MLANMPIRKALLHSLFALKPANDGRDRAHPSSGLADSSRNHAGSRSVRAFIRLLEPDPPRRTNRQRRRATPGHIRDRSPRLVRGAPGRAGRGRQADRPLSFAPERLGRAFPARSGGGRAGQALADPRWWGSAALGYGKWRIQRIATCCRGLSAPLPDDRINQTPHFGA